MGRTDLDIHPKVDSYSRSITFSVGMKLPILQSIALWFFVLSCLITLVGLLGYSFSTYDKGSSIPLLMVLSMCLSWLGGIAALISFVAMLGTVLRRWASHK